MKLFVQLAVEVRKNQKYNAQVVAIIWLKEELNRIAKETKIPIESQKLILLRMMKSVDNMTGGMFLKQNVS